MCLETLLLLSTRSEHKLLTRPEQSSPIRDVWGWLGAATSPEFVSQFRNQHQAHPPGTTKQPVPSPRMESSDWKRSEAQDGDLWALCLTATKIARELQQDLNKDAIVQLELRFVSADPDTTGQHNALL